MADRNTGSQAPVPSEDRVRLRRAMETLATMALLLVAAGMVAPFATRSHGWLVAFKWVFSAGAAAYTAARVVAALGRDESFKVRRLRRMEVWAGMAFCIAASFWWWNTRNAGGGLLTFRMLNETVVFTMAGALIQIVASWLIAKRSKE